MSRQDDSVGDGRWKRVFDLALALPALLLLSPLLLVVALAIRLRMGAPVLFRQPRPGLHGRPFDLLKFRTMTDVRDAHGRLLPDADRLTALGRFLRRTSLDELPELWNVVRGEMSLVGPRPLLMDYLPHYDAFQMRRHEVRPGITGWAQVNGRNDQSWARRFELDVWYVDHRSFALDLRILALTVWKVLKREGISHCGEATMPAFAGLDHRQLLPEEESAGRLALAREADLRGFGGEFGARLLDGGVSTLTPYRPPLPSADGYALPPSGRPGPRRAGDESDLPPDADHPLPPPGAGRDRTETRFRPRQ